MEMDFVRQRITELRIKKGISELAMSTELGHSRSYITHITSGRSNLRLEAFAERLSKISPKEITRSGKERNNGALGFAEAMLSYYNRRIKYPLRQDLLYSGKKRIRYLEEVGMDPNKAMEETTNEEAPAPNENLPLLQEDPADEAQQSTLFDM